MKSSRNIVEIADGHGNDLEPRLYLKDTFVQL